MIGQKVGNGKMILVAVVDEAFMNCGEVPNISKYSILDEKTKRLKRLDKKQRLIVFDDLITDRNANKIASEYYIKGRKVGFSMCYISQSFYQIPKIIRDNTQLFILGRNLLNKDLRMILSTFPTELTIEEFRNLIERIYTWLFQKE